MLRRISGKRKDKTIKYLVTDSDTITNKTDIAETLATSFAAKSSPDHYQEKFRKIRDKEKENTLDFESDNDEKYNVNFSKRELIKSIAQATDSATGPDEIHYQFLLFFCYEYITLVALTILPAAYRGQVAPL